MDAPVDKKLPLIEKARAALGKRGDASFLKALSGDLFARVPREDVAVYSPAEIAGFVRLAGAALGQRRPGVPKIDVVDASLDDDGPKEITVITVVTDNMPFLVDSILGELQDFGAEILLVAHPIVSVDRDRTGRLTAYHGLRSHPAPSLRESLFQAHVTALPESAREALAGRLKSLLGEIRHAVTDWPKMLARLRAIIAEYREAPPPGALDELDEAVAFLEWLADDNFTFLGVRDYDYTGKGNAAKLERADVPGLGVLADAGTRVLRRGQRGVTMTPAIREYLKRPEPLIVTKSNLKSRVHRPTYADYVGVKHYRGDALSGETRFIGLFTSTAYSQSVRSIPYLRRKVANVLARAGFDADSHSGKALVNVLEFYPRDELFQIDEDKLLEFAMEILALEERPRVRVLARRDRYDRFVSVLVYMPRERYDSGVRSRIGDYLASTFAGRVSAFEPSLPEGKLARVHFIIGRDAATPAVDRPQAELEEKVAAIVRTWEDEFSRLLDNGYDVADTERLRERYAAAFPASYRDEYDPASALTDIAAIETLSSESPLAIDFYRLPSFGPSTVGLKLIHRGGPIALSERVPMLEHMGFRVIDERTYDIAPLDEALPVSLHDMTLESDGDEAVDLEALDERLTECLLAVVRDNAESDRYNALVIKAGLGWRDIAMLRSVSRYLQQAGIAYQQDYLAAALNRNGGLAAKIVELFHARFALDAPGEKAVAKILATIEAGLEAVQSLDEDQIIRRFVNVVEAMVRTNFFQPDADGRPRVEISFKLDSAKVDGLPAPKPFREIFLHSPRVEGIHLRFGKVARGGIRWSDRPQDFRTEILGLVKAQQVKNAVIVPVGAKGGFFPKRLPVAGSRDAIMQEGIAAYRIFISSLLDITDNLDEEKVVPPQDVIRRDGDDPYLVVAADKGTATFSDIANEISAKHGFWLDDAFASGGSAGYDHKKMGITARGAWEAVKRHFREMDRDIQTAPFTVVGVGDMSGDVFGNGMLLSPVTKLVAAFDHRDIFIDPDPDPAVSLVERRRLFDMERSSWQDYDRSKISKGGGVFSRKDKAIPLSNEMRVLLDLSVEKATPRDVMRAILRARADLLWFGGIGTFIRASDESDAAVGDRSNDALRVAASALRVPVIGEGANLAMTARARIEFGLAGGRCNTDAIDNSAGVNTSDVEVNIKIALSRATRSGRLTLRKRNSLLASMTDEVAALVLRNNYLQPLALSVAEARGFEDFGYQLRLMQSLEARGLLDRAVETLPDDAAMAARKAAGKPLTRAEIAALLAYAKIVLFDDLLVGDVFDDPVIAAELVDYFPKRMRKPYGEDISRHRLRREIIANRLANAMINHGGPTFIVRLGEGKGSNPSDIARGFVAARESFGLAKLHAEIEALDNRVPGKVQLELYQVLQDVLISRTAWFARNVDFKAGVGPVIEAHADSVRALGRVFAKVLPQPLAEANEERAAGYVGEGVPQLLARRLAALPDLADAADILAVANETGASLEQVARSFYAAADQFGIARLEALAHALETEDYYDELALDGALQLVADAHRRIVKRALAADGSFANSAAQKQNVERIMRRLVTLTEAEGLSVSRVIVAADLLSDLAKA